MNEFSRYANDRCLIAADIDKTLLDQGHSEERELFRVKIAPELIRAADYGASIALLTGNSMEQLSKRFLKWLVSHLCYTRKLHLIDQFHFFCNSGGVYARFLYS